MPQELRPATGPNGGREKSQMLAKPNFWVVGRIYDPRIYSNPSHPFHPCSIAAHTKLDLKSISETSRHQSTQPFIAK
jgi:hypothetical protein